MVSDAAATKAPIAKIADKVSGVFVPVVITIAVITTAVWLLLGHPVGYALARGISVLVISCPCALGLATPVAIMVGSGLGAKNGILFKTAASLEETGRIQIVALDKTGTITSGEPKVTDILPAEGVAEDELLALAYALERRSEHPLARAILQHAEERHIPAQEVTDFQAMPGNGLRAAAADGRTLCGGNLAFIERAAQVVQAAPILNAVQPAVPEQMHTTEPIAEVKEKEGVYVKSPAVGVFYAAPSPDSKPFVAVGDTVHKGDTLCIIEAMKLMNEINSEMDGEIAEICVGNGQVVEYDQPLFRII